MADDVVFQSGTLSTPPAGTRVSGEEVTTLNGGAVTAQIAQRLITALRTGDGTAVDVTSAAPMPVVDSAGNTKLDTLIGHVDGLEGKDFATQTTLAAVLAKLIAAPATEAKQDTIIGHVDALEANTADVATQTTLAALLTELQQKLETGGEVALNAATLAALETISVAAVPADPFGANADAVVAAGATGSIQAKLRRLTSDLDSVKTAVELIDNTVAGSELQVDVVGALPAGTNNIGDVDIATQPSVSSATLSNVNDSATSVQLVASNASRKGLNIFNDSDQALFVKFGTTASTTDFTVKIAAGGYWEMQYSVVYTGRVDGIWAADSTGAARITEM